MTAAWSPLETSTHQDHVIAHVIGATVLGYFIADEAAQLLLDIGFIWTIYPDTEMGLLPQSVALGEYTLDASAKAELVADLTLLHDGREAVSLQRMTHAPVECLITEVTCHALGERRRVLLHGEEASLSIETSPAPDDIQVTIAGETESNAALS
ncbi:MAG: hypothetical protein QOF02_956 [Blastocatellia bacterium]|jgi:hypothetical protein|nr:hypothetical protein [Blastocatellia bacterium]